MDIREFFERYVYVRRCIGCGERMGYEYRHEAFCDACRIEWERAKTMSCPECFAAMAECRCVPKSLSGAGVIEYRKLVAYLGDSASHPENKLLYFLKRNKNERVASFVANQLRYKLDDMLSENGLCYEDVRLVYIPRSRRSCAKYGVDQSRLICESLSAASGIGCLPLIKRQNDGKLEQKRLALSKRMKNAEGLFLLDERYASVCRNKSVILFDDIVTSGASMASAAGLIRGAGAEKIYALSVAYSIKEKSSANFIFR